MFHLNLIDEMTKSYFALVNLTGGAGGLSQSSKSDDIVTTTDLKTQEQNRIFNQSESTTCRR